MGAVGNTSFNKRFKEIVRDLNDTELGYIVGVSADAARKMRSGDIKSLKLQAALRLARKIQVSPWYLAGEPEPTGREMVAVTALVAASSSDTVPPSVR